MKTDLKHIKHLYWRAGFGMDAKAYQSASNLSYHEHLQLLIDDSKHYKPIKVWNDARVKSDEITNKLSDNRRMQLRKLSSVNGLLINVEWLKEMAFSKAMLREKMAMFWHNHFACRSNNTYWMQLQINGIREHALGNFKNLLLGVSKSAAMLQFLNNRQNRKDAPNENFAREVMELFTLGRDNLYTETDIKEAARAFTGWDYNAYGEFTIKSKKHDEGSKEFLGINGNLNGDDVLKHLLKQKQTAKYVCEKLYRYFVNEQLNEAHVSQMTEVFFKGDYEILPVIKLMFGAQWFVEEANIGSNIKSPVELIAGIAKTFKVEFENERSLVFLQKLLGQVLLQPPNVAGWPGGKNWIDSTTLMLRLNLGKNLFENASIQLQTKQEAEELNLNQNKGRRLDAKVDVTDFFKLFKTTKDEELYETVFEYMLQLPVSEDDLALIKKHIVPGQNRTQLIGSIALAAMSIPEFQMC